MSHYDEQRASFVGKSDTPTELKDLWQTPRVLFDNLNKEFNFQLDACANYDNALC